jgi:hypothetical protein
VTTLACQKEHHHNLVTSFHIPMAPFPYVIFRIQAPTRHHKPSQRPHESQHSNIPPSAMRRKITRRSLFSRGIRPGPVYPTLRYTPINLTPTSISGPSRTLAILPAAIVQLTAVRGLPAFQPPTSAHDTLDRPDARSLALQRPSGDTALSCAGLPATRSTTLACSVLRSDYPEPVVAMLASRALCC